MAWRSDPWTLERREMYGSAGWREMIYHRKRIHEAEMQRYFDRLREWEEEACGAA